MSQENKLQAQLRDQVGTGAARAVRKHGLVPGVIYGGIQAPQAISVDEKMLNLEAFKPGFLSRVYNVEINGKETVLVIPRDVQTHPVSDAIVHVDFQRVTKDAKIHVQVPVQYINDDKSPGLKLGGLLNIIIHNLDVVCNAADIPNAIIVDLNGLNINQSIHIDQVELPAGVVAANPNRDYTLVTIVAPAAVEEKASEQSK